MKKVLLFTIFLTLILGTSYAVFKQFNNICNTSSPYNNINTTSPDVKKNNWVKINTTDRVFPILDKKTNNLLVYKIDKNVLVDTNYTNKGYAGSGGLGSTDPKVSYDNLYVVFVPQNEKGLWVLNPLTNDKIKIPQSEYVTYITGWMPHTHKVIYYISPDTIETRKEGMAPWDTQETFTKDRPEGFFMFNVDTGENTSLSPVKYIEEILNGNQLLTRAYQGVSTSDSDKLIAFNTDTFSADYALVRSPFGFGSNQITSDLDGKKWAFLTGSTDTNTAEIIIADFPNKEGTVISTNQWAWIQWPLISPDGHKVIYQKRSGYNENGTPAGTTFIYNPDANINKLLHTGTPVAWIDNQNCVVTQPDTDEYYLINVDNGTTIKMK